MEVELQKIASQIVSEVEAKKNKSKAVWWQNYVKHNAKFLGVPLPEVRKIIRNALVDCNELQDMYRIANSLISLDYSEHKIAGILVYQLYIVELESDKLRLLNKIGSLFDEKKIFDWNVCDWLCVKVFTEVVNKKDPVFNYSLLKWSNEEYLWKARAGIVGFVTNISKKDILNDEFIEKYLDSLQVMIQRDERLAKTSVGWALRELSVRDKSVVNDFLRRNELLITPEVLKNASKYLK